MKLYNKFCKACGLIAQLVEQLTLNQLVEGSSPSEPIKELVMFVANSFIMFVARTTRRKPCLRFERGASRGRKLECEINKIYVAFNRRPV